MKEFHGISPPKWGSGFNSLTDRWSPVEWNTSIPHPNLDQSYPTKCDGMKPAELKGRSQSTNVHHVQYLCPMATTNYQQYDITARKKSFFLNLVKPKHYESIFDPQSHCGRSGRTVNLCCRAAISPLMTLKSSVGPTVSSSWKLGMVGSPGFHGG